MDEIACAISSEEEKNWKRRQRIAKTKYKIWLFFFTAWWRTLHFTGLARPYSKTLCRLNMYGNFPDGRCKYCGKIK